MPAELTTILRRHIRTFGLGLGGRLLVGERNKNELPVSTINRIWRGVGLRHQDRRPAVGPHTDAGDCGVEHTAPAGSAELWRGGPVGDAHHDTASEFVTLT